MPYLVKFYEETNTVDLENRINKFLCENYQQDKEFELLKINYSLATHARILYKCSETNPNYIAEKKKIM